MRRFYLRNRLLPIGLFVLVGSAAQAQKWCNEHFEGETKLPDGSGLAFIDTPKDRTRLRYECVIWMPQFRKGNAFDAGVLAHEALHIAWRLIETIGSTDEEMHCYMVQWIVEETTHRLTRKARK